MCCTTLNLIAFQRLAEVIRPLFVLDHLFWPLEKFLKKVTNLTRTSLGATGDDNEASDTNLWSQYQLGGICYNHLIQRDSHN